MRAALNALHGGTCLSASAAPDSFSLGVHGPFPPRHGIRGVGGSDLQGEAAVIPIVSPPIPRPSPARAPPPPPPPPPPSLPPPIAIPMLVPMPLLILLPRRADNGVFRWGGDQLLDTEDLANPTPPAAAATADAVSPPLPCWWCRPCSSWFRPAMARAECWPRRASRERAAPTEWWPEPLLPCRCFSSWSSRSISRVPCRRSVSICFFFNVFRFLRFCVSCFSRLLFCVFFYSVCFRYTTHRPRAHSQRVYVHV